MKIVLNYNPRDGAITKEDGALITYRKGLEDQELKEPILTHENLEALRKGWREIENTKEAWDECKKAHSKKDQMTEITIKVSEDDFPLGDNNPLRQKAWDAYEEAKAKEIKVGDWGVINYGLKEGSIVRYENKHKPFICTKLPQNLQDGLNEFINEQKE